ncbi:MAG: hypothetical protein K6L76_11635 [Agarilytica sp.]
MKSKQIFLVLAACITALHVMSFAHAESAFKKDDAAHANVNTNKKGMRFETGWLQMETGHEGAVLGAKVTSISNVKDDQLNRVEVTLPQAQGRSIEEVVVVGKRDDADYRVVLEKPVTIIQDYEGGRSGIVIHLGEKMPFKLLINYIEYQERP